MTRIWSVALLIAVVAIIAICCTVSGKILMDGPEATPGVGIIYPVTRIAYAAVKFPDMHVYLIDGSFWLITCSKASLQSFESCGIAGVESKNITSVLVSQDEWKRLYSQLTKTGVFLKGEISTYNKSVKKPGKKS